MTHASRSRSRSLLAISCSALLLVSCSSSGSSDASPDAVSPATSSTAPLVTTTTAPPATDAPTTITEPQWSDEELAIIDAHDQFQFLFVDLLIDDTLDPEVIRSLATVDLGQAIVDLILERRAAGISSRGDIEIRPISVQLVGDDEAEVLACKWDRVERVEDGEVVVRADDKPLESLTAMVREGGSWRIAGVSEIGVERPCGL